MGIAEDVREQYPTLAFLLSDPEVGPLLRDAVDPNKGFSPTTFQAKLYQTKWWRTRSQSQREYDILSNTDPGTLSERERQYRSELDVIASRLGVTLSNNERIWLARSGLRNGTDVNSPMLAQSLLQMRRKGKGKTGAVRTNAQMAQISAKSKYGLTMHQQSALRWGEYLSTGMRTPEDLDQYLRQQAINAYPWLAQSLKAGSTIEEIFDGHRNAIAQTLEVDPNQINFADSKWKKILGVNDPKLNGGKGGMRAMTIGEAQTMARADNRWWKTAEGRQADAGMANTLLSMFGKR